ncbi:MAG: stage II sporulation protein M [Candidatus Viridilinea halotolerans]|uniref:Stage II sporulation protein M n=1 Tax=Candidatus Viridilinea halotolerans TaxID=2491704 RepID=A0A426TR09_9CHLR|nr:MAG: stage II sporulation protein M [Candidatus Viridilinea halotolerans]
MRPDEFITRRRDNWERLEQLLTRAGASLASLSADELRELGRLYRQAAADLAIARRDLPQHPIVAFLNNLVARGHGAIYRESGPGGATHLRTFFTSALPRTFRATWVATLIAFLIFFIPALIGYITTWRDPEIAGSFIPGAERVVAEVAAGNEWWLRINEQGRSIASAEIMTNNIGVAFRAFAGGITLGIYTLYILAFNGLFIGIIAGAAHRFNFATNLWGFIAAHGAIELSVIFIAGGAGLQMSWAILRPGLLTRRTALVVAARRALVLILGCIPLLILAGLIEAFISPSALPLAVKFAVSATTGAGLWFYLLAVGRE